MQREADLKIGLSIAQFRAQPLATHSLALRVLPGSLSNTSRIRLSKAGTLELLPTTSTDEMSALLRPEASRACKHVHDVSATLISSLPHACEKIARFEGWHSLSACQRKCCHHALPENREQMSPSRVACKICELRALLSRLRIG